MSNQISKLYEVKSITGLSGSSIYRMASKGQFPKPIKIGDRASGWLKLEVEAWLKQRIEARNGMEG